MNSKRLAGFVAELGGKRWKADAWDVKFASASPSDCRADGASSTGGRRL